MADGHNVDVVGRELEVLAEAEEFVEDSIASMRRFV